MYGVNTHVSFDVDTRSIEFFIGEQSLSVVDVDW